MSGDWGVRIWLGKRDKFHLFGFFECVFFSKTLFIVFWEMKGVIFKWCSTLAEKVLLLDLLLVLADVFM